MLKESKKRKRVFVMMSGGVDSSVAAYLLKKRKKHEVVGAFIKGYNVDGCQERDVEDARRVAEYLKIPFYVIDLEEDYKKLVVNYMIDGYKKGITPNPDVMCNKEIKFGLFFKKARELGADYVATGHYARLREIKNHPAYSGTKTTYSLFQAEDKNKDQSYFLWTLTQEQLKHCLFPIGDYLKSEVREIAKRAGLPTAEREESQGICFLGMVKLKDFLKQYLSVKKGDVLLALSNAEGKVVYKKIGTHDGVWFYTIGQRHGLGIAGKKPYYVAEKDIRKNLLIVAEGEESPALYEKEIELSGVNFINPNYLIAQLPISVYARIRYRQPLTPATLKSVNKKTYKLVFEQPQKFVAPGQSAVFYGRNGEMLGGGIIV
jgi:tRNA-specific 2-thiouridylase